MRVCSSITSSVRERQDAFETTWIERARVHTLPYGVLVHAKQQREVSISISPKPWTAATWNTSRHNDTTAWKDVLSGHDNIV